MRFINFERTKLPEEILRHNLKEKRKYCVDICLDAERNDAEIQVCCCSYFVSVHGFCVCLCAFMSADVSLKLFMLAVKCKCSLYAFLLNEIGRGCL